MGAETVPDERAAFGLARAAEKPQQSTSVATYLVARSDWLVQCAFLLTQDPEVAQDLAQETVARCLRYQDRVAAAAGRAIPVSCSGA